MNVLQMLPPPGAPHEMRFNQCPFIIWANEKARETVDFSRAVLPNDKTVSAHYLGALLLDILGLSEADPFYNYLNALRPEYPVSTEMTYTGADGVTRAFNPDEDTALSKYKSWSYRRATGKP